MPMPRKQKCRECKKADIDEKSEGIERGEECEGWKSCKECKANKTFRE